MMCGLDERRQAMEKLLEFAAKLDLEFPVVATSLREADKQQEYTLKQRDQDDD